VRRAAAHRRRYGDGSGLVIRRVAGRSAAPLLGALAGTGFAGLLSLLRPASRIGQGLDGWRRAGGVLGAAVGHPLRSLAGPWGAGLILGALAFVGSLILFRLSFDQVWRALRRAVLAVWHAVGGGLRRLTTLSQDQPPPSQAAPTRRFRAGIDHDEEPPAARPLGRGNSAPRSKMPSSAQTLATNSPAPVSALGGWRAIKS